MNILYCGDAGIARGVLVSILSLLINGEKHTLGPANHTSPNNREEKNHTSAKPNYTFYIATINYENVKPFKQQTADFLDQLVKKYNPKNQVHLIDATKIFTDNLPKKNMGSYFTPCSMLRLYIDKIPELNQLDRILYLDYDVVCRQNIEDFYHTNLENIEAAGVLDIYGRRWYKYHGLFKKKHDKSLIDTRDKKEFSFLKQDYMNSGVMLFNIPECKKTNMFKKTVNLCTEKRMMLADQAALNKSITKRKLMPRKYNEQAERPQEDTVLHHFSNNFKFWPYFRVQKIKPYEIAKIHQVLKITEYDNILDEYSKLKDNL